MTTCWVNITDSPEITKILGNTPVRGGIPPKDSVLKKNVEANNFLEIKCVRLLTRNNFIDQNTKTREIDKMV